MLFYFLAGVKNSGYYSSPSYFGKVSRLVYEFGVGNKNWQEWGTKLFDPLFPSAEMRFFDSNEIDSAELWASAGHGDIAYE